MRKEREHLGRENSNIEVAFKIVKNEFVFNYRFFKLELERENEPFR
jgi:hypothetical protein